MRDGFWYRTLVDGVGILFVSGSIVIGVGWYGGGCCKRDVGSLKFCKWQSIDVTKYSLSKFANFICEYRYCNCEFVNTEFLFII